MIISRFQIALGFERRGDNLPLSGVGQEAASASFNGDNLPLLVGPVKPLVATVIIARVWW